MKKKLLKKKRKYGPRNEPKPNKGFILKLELLHQTKEDWMFGALSQAGVVNIPLEEREKYLPIGEIQRGIEDFMDCASRGPLNDLEAQFTYAYRNNLLSPANKLWLEDRGYVVWLNGLPYVVFSDRFVAINSGTTPQGNSLKAPLDAIRKQGLIPKSMLPANPSMDWAQYHDPKSITPEMRDLGADFVRRFTINYERVEEIHFGEALKDANLVVAGYAWPSPENGVYPRTVIQPNHCFILYNLPKFQAFDNYEEAVGDFTKNLSPDYDFWSIGYRVYIGSEQVPTVKNSLWNLVFGRLFRRIY